MIESRSIAGFVPTYLNVRSNDKASYTVFSYPSERYLKLVFALGERKEFLEKKVANILDDAPLSEKVAGLATKSMGSDIKKVYAQAGILSSKDVAAKLDKMINDTSVISMEFDSGTLGSVDGLLNIKYGYDARVEIVGNEGIIFIGDPRHMDVAVLLP